MSERKYVYRIFQRFLVLPAVLFSARRAGGALRHGMKETDGGAMVEMAITFPILMMMLVGIYTFSLTLYQKFELTEGISVAGRTLALARGHNDPCSEAASALYAAAPGLTKTSLTLNFTLNGVATTGASCAGSGGGANPNMTYGANASVHADYPCTFAFFPSWGATFTTQCSLHSGITEVIQ